MKLSQADCVLLAECVTFTRNMRGVNYNDADEEHNRMLSRLWAVWWGDPDPYPPVCKAEEAS